MLPSQWNSLLATRWPKSFAALLVAGVMLIAPSAMAQEAAIWTSFTGGTLGGSSFTVSGAMGGSLLQTNLSGSNFSGSPVGAVSVLAYESSSNLTITFSPPITNPRLYADQWEGVLNPGDYTFNVTPVILSGLVGATLTGSTLSCPPSDYHSGILEFPGSITTLTVTSDSSCCSIQGMTFGVAMDPCGADMFEGNDSCMVPPAILDGTYPGLTIQSEDKDFFSFCIADQQTVTVDALFDTATADLDIFLWNSASGFCPSQNINLALANSQSLTDNESLSWTNSTGADQTVTLLVFHYLGDCNTYDLVITGSGCAPFSAFCDPANLNCNGTATALIPELGTGVASGLRLSATNGSPDQFGYFLVSGGFGESGTAISNGKLCLGGGTHEVGRFNIAGTGLNSIGQFSSDGSQFINLSGTGTSMGGTVFDVPSTLPLTGSPEITLGETWYFQLWHRDSCSGMTGSNFSNGVSVEF